MVSIGHYILRYYRYLFYLVEASTEKDKSSLVFGFLGGGGSNGSERREAWQRRFVKVALEFQE